HTGDGQAGIARRGLALAARPAPDAELADAHLVLADGETVGEQVVAGHDHELGTAGLAKHVVADRAAAAAVARERGRAGAAAIGGACRRLGDAELAVEFLPVLRVVRPERERLLDVWPRLVAVALLHELAVIAEVLAGALLPFLEFARERGDLLMAGFFAARGGENLGRGGQAIGVHRLAAARHVGRRLRRVAQGDLLQLRLVGERAARGIQQLVGGGDV